MNNPVFRSTNTLSLNIKINFPPLSHTKQCQGFSRYMSHVYRKSGTCRHKKYSQTSWPLR